MADIPGDTSTTVAVAIGDRVTGSIEIPGDHDWFRINVSIYSPVTIALNAIGSGGLTDAYLRIRDGAGNIVYENDDGGSGLNSLISFGSTTGGIYYIDVGGFADHATGDYELIVTDYAPPHVATAAQIADQLVSGYWEGDIHRFPVQPGGSISVNLTSLPADAQLLARQALATWSEITGVRFSEVSDSAQITFGDNEAGAFADGMWANGTTTSAHVNVSAQWLVNYGDTVGSYGYQTYLHEIGHALGFGHAGDYNEVARYPYEAKFANDDWSFSVMSYFDQAEANLLSTGYSRALLGTPMQADILAVSRLYGLSTTTRAGDTTYGFNSTAGNPAYDAVAHPSLAYTVFDSGGIDTLDYSGFSAPQRIDLQPGSFSDVGGLIGNVAIAFGTVIENAIGGSGDDVLIGNAAANILMGGAGLDILRGGDGDDILVGGPGRDALYGGAGADIYRDTAANLNSDNLFDVTPEDRIVITDANPATFAFTVANGSVSYTGGQFYAQLRGATIQSAAAVGGGVALRLVPGGVLNDFNGDGHSDILWRNDDGSLGAWLGNGSGGFLMSNLAGPYAVQQSWHVVGTGDFNADGRDDILWRNDEGQVGDWLGTSGGGFTLNGAAALQQMTLDWHVVGTADFDGNAYTDILWRNDAGAVSLWTGNPTVGFGRPENPIAQVDTSWHVVGTGDFDGDGFADILWRNDNGAVGTWLGSETSRFTINDEQLRSAPSDWHVVGTGDFNGDGFVDVLWRNDNGAVGTWLGAEHASFRPDEVSVRMAPTDWHVAGTGDVNGDGIADIIWRNDDGRVGDWLGTSSDRFVVNDAAGITPVPGSWHIQSPDIFPI